MDVQINASYESETSSLSVIEGMSAGVPSVVSDIGGNPLLVENGKAVRLPDSFYVRTGEGYEEPRTAIGQKGPLHYVIIVVDGRRDGYSTGASIPQVQQLFLDEGVDFAFNLDGGGSSVCYTKVNDEFVLHSNPADLVRPNDKIIREEFNCILVTKD